ncbi:MAG TPA: LPS export ABC transporter permease LptF [Alphaproteobacteria bacterium]
MRIIDRYMLRQVGGVTVLVTLTLAVAVWLTQSLRFVELIVNRGLSLDSYLYLTLLLLPRFFYLILPIAVFTAVLFTYNKLIADGELVVLRSAGLAPLQLARPALVLAVIVVAIEYSLSLYFLPLSYREFKDMEFDARSDYSALLLREGSFNDIGEGITVYVRSREADGELRGILLHDTRERDGVITLMAERGRLAITDEGPRVILVNGNRQQVDRENGKLSILYFERYSVDLGGMTRKQTQRWRDPSERYLHELFLPPEEQPADRMAVNRLHAEGHSRLTTPLLAFAFTLLSLAALLSGEFNRRGQSRRVLVAIAIAAVLQAATIALTNLIVRWPVLTPLAYINIAAIAGISLWWMMRTGTPARREPLPSAAR